MGTEERRSCSCNVPFVTDGSTLKSLLAVKMAEVTLNEDTLLSYIIRS